MVCFGVFNGVFRIQLYRSKSLVSSRLDVSRLDVVVPIRREPDQTCPIVIEWRDRWSSIVAASRSSRLNKVCPDNFICLIELYMFNETISNHFVRSESDLKAWNCNSLPLAN